VHPIERLRYVARIGPDRPDLVAREAAGALLAGAGRPAELVVACRRLLDRQPAAGPLWWLVSRALTAPEPAAAIYDALAELDADPTAGILAEAQEPDVVTLDAWMVGPEGVLTSVHEATAAEGISGSGEYRVWAVAGVGRVVPRPVWEAAQLRIERLRHADDVAVLGAEHVDAVVGPWGVGSPAEVAAAEAAKLPLAHEVLGRPRG
jgi:hypothetical protein